MFGALRFHMNEMRFQMDDLEALYYTMLYLARVILPWAAFTMKSNGLIKHEKDDKKKVEVRCLRFSTDRNSNESISLLF